MNGVNNYFDLSIGPGPEEPGYLAIGFDNLNSTKKFINSPDVYVRDPRRNNRPDGVDAIAGRTNTVNGVDNYFDLSIDPGPEEPGYLAIGFDNLNSTKKFINSPDVYVRDPGRNNRPDGVDAIAGRTNTVNGVGNYFDSSRFPRPEGRGYLAIGFDGSNSMMEFINSPDVHFRNPRRNNRPDGVYAIAGRTNTVNGVDNYFDLSIDPDPEGPGYSANVFDGSNSMMEFINSPDVHVRDPRRNNRPDGVDAIAGRTNTVNGVDNYFDLSIDPDPEGPGYLAIGFDNLNSTKKFINSPDVYVRVAEDLMIKMAFTPLRMGRIFRKS